MRILNDADFIYNQVYTDDNTFHELLHFGKAFSAH